MGILEIILLIISVVFGGSFALQKSKAKKAEKEKLEAEKKQRLAQAELLRIQKEKEAQDAINKAGKKATLKTKKTQQEIKKKLEPLKAKVKEETHESQESAVNGATDLFNANKL